MMVGLNDDEPATLDTAGSPVAFLEQIEHEQVCLISSVVA